jgi:hypothetical protein
VNEKGSHRYTHTETESHQKTMGSLIFVSFCLFYLLLGLQHLSESGS